MPLRIGLVNLPELLTDVVCSAFSSEDASFAHLPGLASVRASVAEPGTELDAVVVGVSDAWQGDLLAVTAALPRLAVVGLRHDGRQGWLYELVPHPRELGDLSPSELRATLLAAVRAPTV